MNGYFDNNANYPISNETILDYVKGCTIGNVGCHTKMAQKGRQLIDNFKSFIENEFSTATTKYKVIITSGGSESNSTAISHHLYQTRMIRNVRPHFVSSTVEHPSITEYMLRLEKDGIADVSWVKPQSNGETLIADIMGVVDANTTCVFLQSVNSETGCVQNIAGLQRELARLGVPLHVDHVQGYRKTRYPNGVGDTISLSLHKIGAPLGIGILVYRGELTPLIAGKQNDNMRGGTYNIGTIAAASGVLQKFQMREMKLFKLFFMQELSKYYDIIPYANLNSNLNQYLVASKQKPIIILFSDERCLPHTIFMSILLDGEVLCGGVVKEIMFREGYTIATGTACNSEPTKDKNPIGSMTSSNIAEELKPGFVRISFNNNINEKILRKFASKFNSMNKLLLKKQT